MKCAFELADVALDAGGDEDQDVVGNGHHPGLGLPAEDGDAGLEVGQETSVVSPLWKRCAAVPPGW